MAKVPGFAKVYAGRWAHRRNGHQATFAKAAEFFNALLDQTFRIISYVDCFSQNQPFSTLPFMKDGSNTEFHRISRYDALPPQFPQI